LALPTLQGRAQSDMATAPEQLIRIFGLRPSVHAHEELAKAIIPVSGETGEQYTQRLMEKGNQLQQEEGIPYKQQLSQGFTVSGNQSAPSNQPASTSNQSAKNESDLEGKMPPPGTKWMITPDNFKVPVHKTRLQEARSMGYKDVP